MTTSLFFTASSSVTAIAPCVQETFIKEAGPRELAIETLWPSLTNFDARQLPISPEPTMPIFILKQYEFSLLLPSLASLFYWVVLYLW